MYVLEKYELTMFKKFVQATLRSWIPRGKERVAMLASRLRQVLFNSCLVNEDVSKYTLKSSAAMLSSLPSSSEL